MRWILLLHEDTSKTSVYLRNLIEPGIVAREFSEDFLLLLCFIRSSGSWSWMTRYH